MKKLAVLVAVMLIAGLLAGCWLFPETKLISIVVEPGEMWLEPGDTEYIESITACYDDWSTKVLDCIDCEYLSSDPEVATIDNECLITAKKEGEAYILISYIEGDFWTGKITETDVVIIQVED